MPQTSLLWCVVLRYGTADLPQGTIFDDAPKHACVEELVELTSNHDTKPSKWRCADWRAALVAM
jgi:hypothetical protein